MVDSVGTENTFLDSFHMSSPPGFIGVRVIRSLVLCVCFVDRCPFAFFLLAIVLSVLLLWIFTDSDYPTLAVFLENPEWNSYKLNEQQPNALICTTHSILLSSWSIL
jgi:hypothetical protein